MFRLGPLQGGHDESREYTHLFRRSLQRPFSLSLRHPRTFRPAQHYTLGTGRHFTELTRGEIDDIAAAMKAARLAFLDGHAFRVSPPNSDNDLRQALRRRSIFGDYQPLPPMNVAEVCEALRRAIRRDELMFVPASDELRACVKAIQEDRKMRRARGVQSAQDRNPYATVQQMMGKPPQVLSGSDTPFGDAQPFEYSEDAPDGDGESLAGMPIKGGPPNTWVENPSGSGQLRLYDANGNAAADIDFDHDHGFGAPHSHNWDGQDRDLGNPVSILPY